MGGCATYHPEPLPDSTDLASRADQLKMREENPAANADGSLSLTQVAALAVCNNPDLKGYHHSFEAVSRGDLTLDVAGTGGH